MVSHWLKSLANDCTIIESNWSYSISGIILNLWIKSFWLVGYFKKLIDRLQLWSTSGSLPVHYLSVVFVPFLILKFYFFEKNIMVFYFSLGSIYWVPFSVLFYYSPNLLKYHKNILKQKNIFHLNIWIIKYELYFPKDWTIFSIVGFWSWSIQYE